MDFLFLKILTCNIILINILISTMMIKYLTERASFITVANYTSNNGASDLFGQSGAFQYCDVIMSTLQNFFDDECKKLSGKGVSNSDVTNLQSNYKIIFKFFHLRIRYEKLRILA